MREDNHDTTAPRAEEVRVGVYVCHCGGNISDVVDTAAVAEAASRHPQVAVSRDYLFMCSDPGQKLIIDDILANGINRVVVAACSPTLHELTFRKALERAGLNPYLYEHVNIREQCSWVHKADHGAATEKALRLTLAGVEKVTRQDPLEAIQVKAERHVVVIGGGVAGMRAALSLAQRGLAVTLIEKSGSLGGRVAELDTVFPTEESARELLRELSEALLQEERVSVHLHSQVEQVEGYVGNFTVRLRTEAPGAPAPATQEVTAGALVMATGYDHYEPYAGELGYGQVPEVMTLPEFQRLLSDTPESRSTLLFGGREVRSIAFVHCVGSRQVEGVHQPDSDGHINEGCSRVCCTAALHTINRTLDRFPGLNVYDLYRDIRTYGRGHEEYYEAASKKGVLFLRYREDGLPQFQASKGGGPHTLTVTDWLTWGEEVTLPVDLVVLATGMVPRDISGLVGLLKLPTGTDRFLQEVHPKLRPVELANNGILLAGTCQGPMDIGESCAAAQAAASKASILLAKPTIELDPFVARVNEARCDGCGRCLAECSYGGALTMVERAAGSGTRRVAEVNPALCSGCGACVAVCEPRALDVAGWTLDQFDAMVDAITAEPALAGVGG
ncbi:MAG TPA: CoB--CoM heterodisulfide reductase iron-sulfur subunit A family protein [Armatimonadota bacterium]|jgi:heterodisulfide reductase subunit A